MAARKPLVTVAGSCQPLPSGDTLDAQATGLSIPGQAQGDVLYFDGTNWVRLAPGTSGQLLKTNGAAANPQWATATAGNPPGGSSTQAQYNSAGSFAGAPNLTIDAAGYPNDGDASSTTPAAPTTGATSFARFRAGRRMQSQMGPSTNGKDYCFQPALFANKVGWWTCEGNATGGITLVNFANSTTGTATTRNVATTNFSTSLRRVAYVSSNPSGSSCGTRHGLLQFYRGDAAGRAGFFYVARFVIDTVQTNMRWFVGLESAGTVIGNVNPSTLLNIIGFGIDSGQTTVRFFNNDGAGAAIATDMGASFPAATAGVVYEIRIFSPPNGSAIYYSIERLDSAALSEGNVTTDIPANTTLLSPQIWMNNGTTAAAVAIAIVSQYIETDN